MTELFGLSYSPWTIKTRWVLAHHKISYRYREHLIIFGIPELRWKLRRLRGGVTVPALIDGKTRMMDSLAISEYVDGVGKSAPLFPAQLRGEIERIDRMADEASGAARGIVLARLATDPEAQAEYLPPFVPKLLRPAFRFLCRIGIAYLNREFAISKADLDRQQRQLHDTLAFLRAMIKASGSDYVLGEFSYADISMASVIQTISPFQDRHMTEHPAVARIWTHPEYSREFHDLVEWRDRLYARNGGPKRPA
jgi:glutathione S-transferase